MNISYVSDHLRADLVKLLCTFFDEKKQPVMKFPQIRREALSN